MQALQTFQNTFNVVEPIFFISSVFLSAVTLQFAPQHKNMGSLETIQTTSRSIEPTSSPRISFSADFLDEKNFISISPNSHAEKKEREAEKDQKIRNADQFEFLSSNLTTEKMLTADELFFEGKLLPFRQMHHSEKLNKISLKTDQQAAVDEGDHQKNNNKDEARISWFLDDDPSPRPPKCTVLWKELLRLKKQRASSLSPSSSTSSSNSSSSSIGDVHASSDHESKEGSGGNREKNVRRIKKGLERTRSGSASLRIRPVINVPICAQGKNSSSLPPLFSLKKGRVLER